MRERKRGRVRRERERERERERGKRRERGGKGKKQCLVSRGMREQKMGQKTLERKVGLRPT